MMSLRELAPKKGQLIDTKAITKQDGTHTVAGAIGRKSTMTAPKLSISRPAR